MNARRGPKDPNPGRTSLRTNSPETLMQRDRHRQSDYGRCGARLTAHQRQTSRATWHRLAASILRPRGTALAVAPLAATRTARSAAQRDMRARHPFDSLDQRRRPFRPAPDGPPAQQRRLLAADTKTWIPSAAAGIQPGNLYGPPLTGFDCMPSSGGQTLTDQRPSPRRIRVNLLQAPTGLAGRRGPNRPTSATSAETTAPAHLGRTPGLPGKHQSPDPNQCFTQRKHWSLH